jgi:hypothetical protein
MRFSSTRRVYTRKSFPCPWPICMPYMYTLHVYPIYVPYMYALSACLICMPYMPTLYVCLICMPGMYTLYEYPICMPSMHTLYACKRISSVCALYACLICSLCLCLICMPYMCNLCRIYMPFVYSVPYMYTILCLMCTHLFSALNKKNSYMGTRARAQNCVWIFFFLGSWIVWSWEYSVVRSNSVRFRALNIK